MLRLSCEKTIIAPTETIGFSSITNQGMPFYGGNITYIMELETTKCCCISIKASNYRGAAIKAAIDGKSAGIIAYAPYKVMAENIKPGKHKIELTLYGNRYNTFAALHNTNTANRWYGLTYGELKAMNGAMNIN